MLRIKLRSSRPSIPRTPSSANLENGNKRSASARSMAKRREELKKDPVAWKEYKAGEADRHRQRRKNRTEEQIVKDREKARLRTLKYYAKKREEGNQVASSKAKRILTRTETKNIRDYWRERQAACRAKKSAQKIRRDREKDRERKRKATELKKKKAQKKDVLTTPSPNIGYPTKSSANKAVSRLWSKLPSEPEKFSEIINGLFESRKLTPRKRHALEKRGLSFSCRKKLFTQDMAWRTIRGHLKRLVEKKDESRRKRSLILALEVKKKYRLTLARDLEVRPNYLTNVLNTTRLEKGRKRRRDATCINTVCSIQDFYRSPAISRELPTMRTVVTTTDKQELQQRRVMEMTTKWAYTLWKQNNPDQSVVSLSVFQKLRPQDVLLMRQNQVIQCLCEYCTDAMLKIKVLDQAASSCGFKNLKLTDRYQLVEETLCPKPDDQGHFNLKCVNRNCDRCGTKLLDSKYQTFLNAHGEKSVSWKKWENITYTHCEQSKSKKILKVKTGTAKELYSELRGETEELAKHIFVAKWQQQMYSFITKNIQSDETVLVLDFSENYSCLMQDEIQSAHWAIEQVTLHPIVAFYRCNEHADEDEQNGHIVQEAIMIISEDLKHDAHAVHHFTHLALAHLRDERGLQFKKVVEFTDGCSQQYKSKLPFADISFAERDFNVKLERHFFGSRHGKGPLDGVSGVIKSSVRRAVIGRQVVVNNAQSMFDYCKEFLTKHGCERQRRTFLFVKRGDINRDRPSRLVKSAVAGTRLFHAVGCVEPGVIEIRLLSCFCPHCCGIADTPCPNSSYTVPWQRSALDMVNPIPTEDETDQVNVSVNSEDIVNSTGDINTLWDTLMGKADPKMTDGITETESIENIDNADGSSDDITSLLSSIMAESTVTPQSTLTNHDNDGDITRQHQFDGDKIINLDNYYYVYFSRQPYIGRVIELLENGMVVLRFLHKYGSYYALPARPDEETVHRNRIFYGPLTVTNCDPKKMEFADCNEAIINKLYKDLKKVLH